MAIRSVGFQLRTDGKAEVKNDFQEVAQAGKSAMNDVGTAAEQSAARAAKASDDFTTRQEQNFRRQANAAKLAAAGASARSAFDQAASAPGNGAQFATVNLDRSSGQAKASASVFEEAFAREAVAARDAADAERLAAQAEGERVANLVKLRAAIDPVSIAQARFGADVAAADELLAKGAISVEEHASALKLYGERLADAKANLDGSAKADAEAEAAALRLRTALDPLWAAQKRYDDEIASHNDLLARGKISEAEHALATKTSTDALGRASRALEEHSSKLGLNRVQYMVGASAAHRFVDSIIAGQSPMRAFMQQAGDVATVLEMDDGGMAGGLAKVRSLLTPTNLLIGAGATALAIGASAWIGYSDAVGKLNAVAQGTGRLLGETGEQLEANAEAAAHAGGITVSAARDIETGYLQIAKSGDVLVALTTITGDFAAATGQDAKAATQELGAAFADPIAGAQTMAEKYGLLSQAQADHIAKLVEEGDMMGAQRALYEDFSAGVRGAAHDADGLAGALHGIWVEAGNAYNAVGKFFDTYGPDVLFNLTGVDVNALAGRSGQAPKRGSIGDPAANSARARANAISDGYTGASALDPIRRNTGALRAAIAAGGTPEQVRAWTQALDANQHALTTWIPAQEKANQLATLDAKIAAAKTPAAKAALAAQRENVAMAGQVVSSADATARAHAKADAAAAHSTKTHDGHAKALARDAASMEVNASAALDVADAYLKSSAAGLVAEARRKAATDATKKGIDVEAQARRQLNLQAAEGAANGAKAVATLNDETDARAKINAAVADGTLTTGALNQALADQNTLRPLIALRDAAEGEAKARLTTVIDAYTAALKRSHGEEANTQMDKAISDSRVRIGDLQSAIADLNLSPLNQALNAAQRAALDEADAQNMPEGKKRTEFVRSRVSEAQNDYGLARAKYAKDALDSQADALALTQRELELVGANDNYRTAELDKLKAALEIKRRFPDLAQADADRILAGVDAQDALNAKLKVSAAAMDELHGFGVGVVDDVLDGGKIKSWGDMWTSVIGDVKAELIKLALMNPLKNLLSGNSNAPTIGSVLGKLGSLFGGNALNAGGGKYEAGISPSIIAAAGHNATGTENWHGGLTWVNENGPELLDLPSGTRVVPAAQTRRLLAANENGAAPRGDTHYHLTGNLLTPEFWASIHAGDDMAAARGAAGGAEMSKAQSRAGGARKLGRRWS